MLTTGGGDLRLCLPSRTVQEELMRLVLSVVVLAWAAGWGMAQGGAGPGFPSSPAPSTAVAGQGAELPPTRGIQPAPPSAPPNCAPAPETLAADESRGPAGQFWLRGEYLLW